MAKVVKGLGGRIPPEASSSHDVIVEWIGRQMPDLQHLLTKADEEIRGTLRDLQYAVKWKRAYYGLPEYGWIIELAAYDVSMNVVFLGGADFDPPPPLGTTDRSRYVKVTNAADLLRPELHVWVEQAGRTPGWK